MCSGSQNFLLYVFLIFCAELTEFPAREWSRELDRGGLMVKPANGALTVP